MTSIEITDLGVRVFPLDGIVAKAGNNTLIAVSWESDKEI
jgi:hypothetical protein